MIYSDPMKITKISFLNGWSGATPVRIKAFGVPEATDGDDKPTEYVLEAAEAERILLGVLNAGYTIGLKPAQKIRRIEAIGLSDPKDNEMALLLDDILACHECHFEPCVEHGDAVDSI